MRIGSRSGGEEERVLAAALHAMAEAAAVTKAEEGAPLGRFRSAQIGTGEGSKSYGYGLNFASKKEVAEFYKGQSGSLYKVELAPKENTYLYWDKPFSEHPKEVREKYLGLLRRLERESDSEYAQYKPSERLVKYDFDCLLYTSPSPRDRG